MKQGRCIGSPQGSAKSHDRLLLLHSSVFCRLETAKLMATALQSDGDVEEGGNGVDHLNEPAYMRVKQLCHQDMSEIKTKMGELRSLHGRASLSKFDESKEDELAVEVATQALTKLFRRCESRLKSMSPAGLSADVDDKIRRNMQRTIAVELQKLSVQFRKMQKQYLQRLKARDGNASPAAGALSWMEGGQSNDESSTFVDPGFSQSQLQQANLMEALVEGRDSEVIRVVSSISELAQIMKDLSVLVIEQGTVLDRIDYNLEQTASRIDQGVRQLKRADRAQRRGLVASCVMILLVAVAAMLVVVVVKAVLS